MGKSHVRIKHVEFLHKRVAFLYTDFIDSVRWFYAHGHLQARLCDIRIYIIETTACNGVDFIIILLCFNIFLRARVKVSAFYELF